VDQFPYDTGKTAAQQLVEQIDTKNSRHTGLRIDCKLVIRASCAQVAPDKANLHVLEKLSGYII
jgi:DNA-binding LacI/PurR family transcriptional regulator